MDCLTSRVNRWVSLDRKSVSRVFSWSRRSHHRLLPCRYGALSAGSTRCCLFRGEWRVAGRRENDGLLWGAGHSGEHGDRGRHPYATASAAGPPPTWFLAVGSRLTPRSSSYRRRSSSPSGLPPSASASTDRRPPQARESMTAPKPRTAIRSESDTPRLLRRYRRRGQRARGGREYLGLGRPPDPCLDAIRARVVIRFQQIAAHNR